MSDIDIEAIKKKLDGSEQFDNRHITYIDSNNTHTDFTPEDVKAMSFEIKRSDNGKVIASEEGPYSFIFTIAESIKDGLEIVSFGNEVTLSTYINILDCVCDTFSIVDDDCPDYYPCMDAVITELKMLIKYIKGVDTFEQTPIADMVKAVLGNEAMRAVYDYDSVRDELKKQVKEEEEDFNE